MQNNDKDEIISYNNNHTCIVNMQKVQNLKIMNETKDTISNTEIIFNVKEKQVFDLSVKKRLKKTESLPESSDNEEDNNSVNIKSKITPIFTNVKNLYLQIFK